MTDRPGLDFSFSGLKTAALTATQQNALDERTIGDIAFAFQEAAVDTLVIKCARALEQTGHTRLVIAGGVGANVLLRERLTSLCAKMNARIYYPRPVFCTDNGAMIAYAGALRLKAGQHEGLALGARARWSLVDLATP
jgi:N6-L-threonylcarbamoyladenine synthase